MSGWHGFHFVWGWALWLLLLLPVWFALRLRGERRRWQDALRFSQASLLAHLALQKTGAIRLIQPLLTMLMLACLIIALARPAVVARVPVSSVDMMLVMDISLSMMADDIPPDRLSAARDAGVRFIESLPEDTRIGLEVFAGDSYVLSPPRSDHGQVADILRQLDRDDLRTHTRLGDAIQVAATVLTPEAPKSAKPAPRIIILLSDGDSREGYPWEMAAQEARQKNITIHTIGVGHDASTSIRYQPPGEPLPLDLPVLFSETTLTRIAELGGGQYFRVADRADFPKVYEQIRERAMHTESRTVDVGYWFCALALSLAFGLSHSRRGL